MKIRPRIVLSPDDLAEIIDLHVRVGLSWARLAADEDMTPKDLLRQVQALGGDDPARRRHKKRLRTRLTLRAELQLRQRRRSTHQRRMRGVDAEEGPNRG